MNLDLLVSGFCVVFDEPSVDGRPAELRQDYDWFPGFADSLPLRVDHHVIVTSSGAYDAGRVGRFAIVEGSPPIPHGVLCLAECADNDIGQSVFEAVARGELWGFSLGGNGRAEISLYANCRVVGCGVHALAAWELLTGGGARRLEAHAVAIGVERSCSSVVPHVPRVFADLEPDAAASGGCMINLTGSARA